MFLFHFSLEHRTKELESRLELEQATKARLEIQCNRHKDALDKIQTEITLIKTKEQQANDNLKKTQKTLRYEFKLILLQFSILIHIIFYIRITESYVKSSMSYQIVNKNQ